MVQHPYSISHMSLFICFVFSWFCACKMCHHCVHRTVQSQTHACHWCSHCCSEQKNHVHSEIFEPNGFWMQFVAKCVSSKILLHNYCGGKKCLSEKLKSLQLKKKKVCIINQHYSNSKYFADNILIICFDFSAATI